MADLTAVLGRNENAGGGDRGQMIIVAAFVLAVSIVALALILNSAIFTQNLASRSGSSGTTEALAERSSVEQGVGDLMYHLNYEDNPGTYLALETEMDSSLETWSPARASRRRFTVLARSSVTEMRISPSTTAYMMFDDWARCVHAERPWGGSA